MVESSLPVPTAIYVDGLPLPLQQLELLTSLRIETAVNLVGRTTMRFADVGYQLSSAEVLKIGTTIEVKVPDSQALLFTGSVDSIALDHSASHVPELVVTAEEPTGKLARSRHVRTFESQSTRDVLRKLCSEVGCSISFDGDLLTSTTAYLLQTGTALALLDEVVRTNGGLWWFEPPRTLHIAPVDTVSGAPVPISFPGDDSGPAAEQRLLTFSVRANGGQPASATVTNWRGNARDPLTGADTSAPPPAESAFVGSARSATAPNAVRLVTNAGETTDTSEAQQLARSILGSARSDIVTGRGTALVDPRIRPNLVVEVTGAGPSSGKYRVTRVEHVYDRRGFHTTFHTGSHRPRGLVDTLAGATGLPDARIDGVLCGIVADLKDPENCGRVRVTFPALQQERQPRDVMSNWARVATFDAGSGRGATFLPEVGDEVLVAFEGGSTRFPVVIGAMFSSQRRHPELERLLAADGTKVKTRRLTSRTGHALEMVDEQGAGQVLLQHGAKPMRISMDEQTETLTVEATSGKLVLSNGRAKITLDKSGDVTLEGTKVTVKATADVAVDAGTSAALKAKTSVTVEGVNATVKGTVAAKLEGGASTAISGGSVAIN
jgi:uncharacterized protein involved in type VI secretion and phage assembly